MGLFLDPDRALLWWKTQIHHIIFGLSTYIPMGFFGFFFFLYPPTYSSASLVFAFGLGEQLGNTRRVRLLSVAPPVLGLPFLPCGFGISVVPPVRGRVGPSR